MSKSIDQLLNQACATWLDLIFALFGRSAHDSSSFLAYCQSFAASDVLGVFSRSHSFCPLNLVSQHGLTRFTLIRTDVDLEYYSVDILPIVVELEHALLKCHVLNVFSHCYWFSSNVIWALFFFSVWISFTP